MSLADGAIILLLLIGTLRGWTRGGLAILADLTALLAGLVAALALYPGVAALLQRTGMGTTLAGPLAFLGVWMLVHLLAGAALARLFTPLSPGVHRSAPNRIAGAALGFGKWVVYAGLLLLLLTSAPGLAPFKAQISGSRLAAVLLPPARAAASWTVEALGPRFLEAVGDLSDLLTIRPPVEEDDPAYVDLGFRGADGSPDPRAEEAMLELINRERVARGLTPLVMDERLREVARAHSRDMLARGYFGHVTPDGVSPARRVIRRNIPFVVMGENLAFAPTVRLAHGGLMRSPGHRRNILHPAFGRVGIGAIDAGVQGTMFTQNFAD